MSRTRSKQIRFYWRIATMKTKPMQTFLAAIFPCVLALTATVALAAGPSEFLISVLTAFLSTLIHKAGGHAMRLGGLSVFAIVKGACRSPSVRMDRYVS